MRRGKGICIVLAILGLLGQGVAVARHVGGGPPATPPGHGGVPPGHGGVPPGHAGDHGQPAAASNAPAPPGKHAGAHGQHAAGTASDTHGKGHRGHPGHRGHSGSKGKASSSKAPSSSQSAGAQPSSTTRSPRLARSLHALEQSSLGAVPLIVPGLGTTLGGTGSARPLTGALPLSSGTLHALVPAIHVVGKPDTRRAAASQAQVVGVRRPDPSSSNVIQRFERVVPLGVWIALVAALALAATGGVATAVAGRRSRRQATRLAAVSAQALTDPLTGVLNRRGFLDAVERELARARRYERPVALAYVDVRGLKAVNDSEGHLAGDELLRAAASLLQDSARADDVVGRIGGDELAVLLGEQSSDGATAVATRIQAQVPARRAALQLREPWGLTIGTATYPADGATVDELFAAADRRLYEQRGIEIR